MLSTLVLVTLLGQGQLLDVPKDALVIKDLVKGEGDEASFLDLVEVHYTGKLLTGKKFDSSLDRGQPFTFQIGVGGVIQGWDEGFRGMKVGGERDLLIGSAKAYGERGAGEDIPPNAPLNFKVKLMRVLPRVKVETITKGEGDRLTGMNQILTCKLSLKSGDGPEIGSPDQPIKLGISPQMLAGLNQAIHGIQKGEVRKVTINSELAFGKNGFPATDKQGQKAGSIVKPNAEVTALITAVDITNVK